MILFKQMMVLFVIMIFGFGMARKGVLDKHVCKSISWMIVNVANPALIISGSLESSGITQSEFLILLGMAFLMFVVLIILGEIVVCLFHFNKKENGVYKVMFVFSNIGFMGFPIISAMYGAEALLYASVFLLPFNLLIYTYGIYSMSGQGMGWKYTLKKIANAGVLACILTFVIAFCRISLPEPVEKVITMLSQLTAPLSMMVIGASFAEMKIREVFSEWKLLAFTAVKLFVVPLAGYLVLHLVVKEPMLLGVIMILLSTPAASMAAMLAEQYDGDVRTASKGIAITTLISILSMPLVFAIAGL